jgi:maltose alpha-D-glucosyltransferase/alpha-amylase
VLDDGETQRYFLPLAACWQSEGSEARNSLLSCTLATMRQFRRDGALIDGSALDRFAGDVVAALRDGRHLALEGTAEIRFEKGVRFAEATAPETLAARRLGGEQSNTSILIAEYAILKIYRRLRPGLNPEIEMVRFLSDRTDFSNTPPLLGTIELREAEGTTTSLGVLFGFVRNQGEAWTQALDYLTRFIEEVALVPAGTEPAEGVAPPSTHRFYFTLARQLGRRTAEMHRALCPTGTDDPDFAPEPICADDLAAWRTALADNARATLAALERRLPDFDAETRALAERVLAARGRLETTIEGVLPATTAALKTRYHGDFHLGQVLVIQNDYSIIDFEGEPLRPIEDRRRKTSPLKDIAGMVRSFHYAETTAVRNVVEIQPASRETAARSAGQWRRESVAAFLGGYFETLGDCPSVPADAAENRALLDFFTLEKAIYEVAYELANRPSWVAIPLAGIVELLELAAPATAQTEGSDGSAG